MHLTELSNEEVLSSLKALVGDGRRILAKVIAFLAEVETRRIHLELACSSMFDFCTRKLGFSEGEAFRRLTAARLARRFPPLVDALAEGRIHLTSVVLLRDHFTEDNLGDLIEAASGKSKREVEELVARLAPKPDVASTIRKLPEPALAPIPPREVAVALTLLPLAQPPPAPKPAPLAAPAIQPLAEARYRVQLTASAALRDKLEKASAMMRHRHPTGDLADIVDQAMDLLLAKLEAERFGATSRPRPAKAPSDPGHISQSVRREVTARDGARCSFVSDDGERCPSQAFLEFDHRQPRALGGTGKAPNVRILCRAHNRHAAEKVFGRERVAERIRCSQRKYERVAGTDEARSGQRHQLEGEVRTALRHLGFRAGEAERAIAALDRRGWVGPIERLVRDAIGVLQP